MSIRDELNELHYNYQTEEKVPCHLWLTKSAEETIYFYSKQMGCKEDEALDLLLHFLAFTDVCVPVLEQLGYQFDSKKAP